MFNLFDILQSQAGPGMQAIGQQFGLTQDQSRRAVEALLPAVAAGLQHSAASDPLGFGRFLGNFGMAPYLDARPQAAPPQPDILGQLFGSPMLSQAVLQQASAVSGIGTQALRQMLPVMSGMVVAGIIHVLLNQGTAQVAQAPPPPPPEPGFPVARFWNDWMNHYLGAPELPRPGLDEPSSKQPEPAGGSASRSTLEPIAKKPTPEPDEAAKALADDAPFEAFQQLFQTGVQVQEQNAKAMQDIFDAFWSSPSTPEQPAEAPAQPAPPATARRRAAKSVGPRAGAARKRPARRKDT